jgi:hypothetical protein
VSRDLRDQELADRLEAAIAHVAPDPADRARSVRRRGSIRRVTRWSAVAAALAVFLGSLGWAAFALRGSSRPTALPAIDTSGWRTYDGLKPWVLRYPPGWHVAPYGAAGGHCGVLISNVDHQFRHPVLPDTQTTAWDFRGLPDDLAVIDLHTCDLGPIVRPTQTIFPLSLDDLPLVTAPPNLRFGAPQPFRVTRIWPGFTLAAWFGPDASAHDRAAAAAVIGSLQVPLPYADAALELPGGWYGRSIQYSHTAALFVATKRDAIEGVIRGCMSGSCFIGSVNALKLGPADAYVQVKGFYLPRSSVTPLPPIRPESFHRSGEWLGAPIMELAGDPAGGGNGHFVITYWMGPQATAQVRSQVVNILSGLHLVGEAAP